MKYFTRYQTATGKTARIFGQDQRGIEWGRRVYSDKPHLERKALHECVGLYHEELSMCESEIDFRRRFLAQDRFLAAYIEDYEVFEHIGGDASFNPCVKRGCLRKKLLANPTTKLPMKLYWPLNTVIRDRTMRSSLRQ